MPAAGGQPLPGLAAFLAFLVAQRGLELAVSSRNIRRLRARGAREFGRDHLPVLIVMHTLFPLALIGEVLVLHPRPGPMTPFGTR